LSRRVFGRQEAAPQVHPVSRLARVFDPEAICAERKLIQKPNEKGFVRRDETHFLLGESRILTGRTVALHEYPGVPELELQLDVLKGLHSFPYR
jgi:hypothetical protein